MNKINLAIIYDKNFSLFSKDYYATYVYHFILEAFKRNTEINVTYYPIEKDIDVSDFKQDVILLFCSLIHFKGNLIGIHDNVIPVIAYAGDSHYFDKKLVNELTERFEIDYYFGFIDESNHYRYFPSNTNYKKIVFGIEPSIYENVKLFDERITSKILNSGRVGNNKILNRLKLNLKYGNQNPNRHYKLRTKCNELDFVDYTETLSHEFVGDKYTLLLQKYQCAIASTTEFATPKYWEIPASGCVCFMEVTKKNNAVDLGFEDGLNAVFIDENNYLNKFTEFMADRKNPKWKNIGENGRKFALENFNNDIAVQHFVDLIRDEYC